MSERILGAIVAPKEALSHERIAQFSSTDETKGKKERLLVSMSQSAYALMEENHTVSATNNPNPTLTLTQFQSLQWTKRVVEIQVTIKFKNIP